MPAIIALAAIAIVIALVVMAVLSFAVHLLFSPWLLVPLVAILLLMKFRPRRSQR